MRAQMAMIASRTMNWRGITQASQASRAGSPGQGAAGVFSRRALPVPAIEFRISVSA